MSKLNDEDIKVSVYCLTYNHEKYVRQTLEGFVNQITTFKFEVFVHDDASTDHTPDIIKEYAAKYPNIIKPILQQENQYSKGINICTKFIFPQMHGKYIASCEGDDFWTDQYKLQEQFMAMEEHPECSLCTHLVQCCNEDGTFNDSLIPDRSYHIKKSGVIKEGDLARYYWIDNGYPFHTSSYFFRRCIADIQLEYPRDIGILRKCLTSGAVYYIDKPMSVRRLWSIGNWNWRMRSKGAQGVYDLTMNDNEAEGRFDQYTKYKYHEYIEVWRIKKFMGLIGYPEYYDEIVNLMKQYNLSLWKIRKKISIYMFCKLQIKYFIATYFPQYYPRARK